MTPTETIEEIYKIVRVPTNKTRHKTASDHFQADFDAIRKLCRDYLGGNAP